MGPRPRTWWRAGSFTCSGRCDRHRRAWAPLGRLLAYPPHEIRDRLPDLVRRVLLDEMEAVHCHLGLVRPGATQLALAPDQDRARIGIDEQLRDAGLREP